MPVLNPDLEALDTRADTPGTQEVDALSQPQRRAPAAAPGVPMEDAQPVAKCVTSDAATPSRQRSADFLSPLPRREAAERKLSLRRIILPHDYREHLRALMRNLLAKLRSGPRRQFAEATSTVPHFSPAQAPSMMPVPTQPSPPVPQGYPPQPLATRWLQIVSPVPRRFAAPAALRRPSAEALPTGRATSDGTEPEDTAAAHILEPRPPGESIQGLLPQVLVALQPEAEAQRGSASPIGPEFLRGLLPHRHAAEAAPPPTAGSLSLAEEAPTLSLLPWLLHAPTMVWPDNESPADDAFPASAQGLPKVHDSASHAATRLRRQAPNG